MIKDTSFRSIVLGHIADKSMTIIELCEVTGKSPVSVNNAICSLYTMQMIHVAEYRSNGTRIVKAFRAGKGVDAERPKGSLTMLDNAPAVLLKLQGGDYTRVELSAMLGWNQRHTYSVLEHLMATNQIHVTRHGTGTNNQRVKVYRAGPGKNAPDYKKKLAPVQSVAPVNIPAPDPLVAALFGRRA